MKYIIILSYNTCADIIQNTNLVYSPTDDEISRLKPDHDAYWEVWKGLPDIKQVTERCRSGALFVEYERNGDYICIPKEACDAYKKDENTLFIAENQTSKQAWQEGATK